MMKGKSYTLEPKHIDALEKQIDGEKFHNASEAIRFAIEETFMEKKTCPS